MRSFCFFYLFLLSLFGTQSFGCLVSVALGLFSLNLLAPCLLALSCNSDKKNLIWELVLPVRGSLNTAHTFALNREPTVIWHHLPKIEPKKVKPKCVRVQFDWQSSCQMCSQLWAERNYPNIYVLLTFCFAWNCSIWIDLFSFLWILTRNLILIWLLSWILSLCWVMYIPIKTNNPNSYLISTHPLGLRNWPSELLSHKLFLNIMRHKQISKVKKLHQGKMK